MTGAILDSLFQPFTSLGQPATESQLQMYFRLDYTVRDLSLPPESKIEFDFGNPHRRKVELRCPSEQEQAKGHSKNDCFCTTSALAEPNPKVAFIFSQIETGDYPSGDKPNLKYLLPNGTQVLLPSLIKFPENFRSYVEGVLKELNDLATRTISVLLWRSNELGPHNRISTRGLHWSKDASFWHPMPSDTRSRLTFGFPMNINRPLDRVQSIVADGNSEPLYHDLFREAWEQCFDKPRSALVIGMAACEIAVKRCISVLVPEAEWLATNLPTPPLPQILMQYFPQLPARCTFNGIVKPPPKHAMDDLKDGATIRNSLVHAGANPPAQKVESILRSVRDVLWMVDYYCGAVWALEYIRPETSSALTGESK